MLDQLFIFTRGGLILWTCGQTLLRGSPVDALIRSCLLEERSAESSYDYDPPIAAGGGYTLKWAFHNELGLVFVAVYQRILRLLYVDDLLAAVRREFSLIYDPKRPPIYPEFNEIFNQLQLEAEARSQELRLSKQPASKTMQPSKKNHHANGKLQKSNRQSSSAARDGDGGDGEGNGDSNKKGSSVPNGKPSGPENGIREQQSSTNHQSLVKGNNNKASNSEAFDVNKLQKLTIKGGKKKASDTTRGGAKGAPKAVEQKAVKKNRVWDDSPSDARLDFTDPVQAEGGDSHADIVIANQGHSLMDREEIISSESEEEDEEDNDAGVESANHNEKKGWFSSIFQSMVGNAVLEMSALKPALKALKDRLMTKNVAEEIAEKLCESVAASLVGKKLGSFTRVSSTVQEAMEEALLRILTPKRSIDILRDVHVAKEQGKPYVIVFVGVNGVGKSTNLAKVAYWLLQHNVSVMMAACDTFRSGAVEQLRTHARRLQIPIFEKGYEKDPAVVAKEAIVEASHNNSDVVLVDTAGRMQDNEPLMRALSKLINLNKPDLVLFVGEALVGNDAVDQLSKFNQKLADLSTTSNASLIDGIVLTKFDTIDDKVGAALSMVYVSGAPVMFVGCGQSYTDLKKLNVKSIVKTLLK